MKIAMSIFAPIEGGWKEGASYCLRSPNVTVRFTTYDDHPNVVYIRSMEWLSVNGIFAVGDARKLYADLLAAGFSKQDLR